MKKVVLGLCIFLFLFILPAKAEARTWTSGKHTVEAEFVKISEDGKSVTLRRSGTGKETSIPLEKLSKEDREYVVGKKRQKSSAENSLIYHLSLLKECSMVAVEYCRNEMKDADGSDEGQTRARHFLNSLEQISNKPFIATLSGGTAADVWYEQVELIKKNFPERYWGLIDMYSAITIGVARDRHVSGQDESIPDWDSLSIDQKVQHCMDFANAVHLVFESFKRQVDLALVLLDKDTEERYPYVKGLLVEQQRCLESAVYLAGNIKEHMKKNGRKSSGSN